MRRFVKQPSGQASVRIYRQANRLATVSAQPWMRYDERFFGLLS